MDNMENLYNGEPRRPNPRRRKRDPVKEFIRTYVPLILVVLVIILFIIFVVGSIKRSNKRREEARLASIASQQAAAQQQLDWEVEAARLVEEANILAAGYDYDAAIRQIESFSGNLYDFDELVNAKESFERTRDSLIAWSDPGRIVNLSFNLLVADPQRAYANSKYGSSFARNFITVSEFTNILTQLHENGYVLVDLDDFIQVTTDESGKTTYAPKTIYLPGGKKPLVLTQTHVNYNTYMIDSDGDGLADKGGSGFASRLVLDANGALTCEYVDKNGNVLTGAYDMVPILNTFIQSHPDFSYQGARAILAVSGYDGLFGYRTDPETAEKISQEYYDQQLQQVPAILDALRRDGYTIACYTYDNLAYGSLTPDELQEDLDNWTNEVTPILGETPILVYAKESDIGRYQGEKYDRIINAGFRYFLGFCEDVDPWIEFTDSYVRQGRILVNGSNLGAKPYLFIGMFDAKSVLDPAR